MPSYDREVLVTVLVYHQHTNTSGCICGWAVLGASHPEHVADAYEQAVTDLIAAVGRERGCIGPYPCGVGAGGNGDDLPCDCEAIAMTRKAR